MANIHDYGTAEIEFAPICTNCRTPLLGCNVSIEYDSLSVGTFPSHYIEPSHCPSCGRPFTAIFMPTKLPYNYTEINCRLSQYRSR